MYPRINLNDLEQSAEIFYERLTAKEKDSVRITIDSVSEYMSGVTQNPFLIAGVGGILRYENPELAQDIDLAVVGLSYTPHGEHNFSHVANFTNTVRDYFTSVIQKLGLKADYELKKMEKFSPGSCGIGRGSGPFAGIDDGRIVTKGDERIEIETNIEIFGPYNSKGLQIRQNSGRAIDVQFVFNNTIEEWKNHQKELQETGFSKKEGRTETYPYAVLYQFPK